MTGHRRWIALGLCTAVLTAAAAAGSPAGAAPRQGTILHSGGPTAVAGEYIAVLSDRAVAASAVESQAATLATRYGGTVLQTFRHALRGFAIRMPEPAARALAAEGSVSYLEQSHSVRLAATQSPTPSWGLDRLDQRAQPLDDSYSYPTLGSGVRAYIIDTGVRFSHQTFGGRAVSGRDTVSNDNDASDCNGHGTHVAGTVGGSQYGVAKGVTIVGVRVLDCSGGGSYATILAGIDWVTGDHDPGELAVANMSLGGPLDTATNTAVTNSIADGITYSIAAGNNSGLNACNVSPASTPNAITVAATDSTDARAPYSNIGTCVDIFAPGTGITSSWYTDDTATNTINGTSMAAPHVTGAAALILAANPTFTPQQVRDKLVADATPNVVGSPGAGSPNRLLYVAQEPAPSNNFSLAISPAAGTTGPGGTVNATVSTATTAGSAQPVALTATGVPAGATATFAPSSVTSGGSAALTISTTASTPPGTYPIIVTGTGTGAVRTASYTLTVNSPASCSGTNGTHIPIPDKSTIESTIVISGCSGYGSATATVAVDITQPWRGDLIVTLVAQDGSTYVLHNRSGGGTDDVKQTFTVNLASTVANGTWRLRVTDQAAPDAGTLNSWALNTGGGGAPVPPCRATNGTDFSIQDNTTVESPITIAGCAGNAPATSTVEVHIVHKYQGDLAVTLIAPDGSSYVLHNRTGGDADNIDQTYQLNLTGEARNGVWRLRVQDAAFTNIGFLDSWTLAL